MKKRVYLFGAGGSGELLFDQLKDKYEIIGFLDNDTRKHGSIKKNIHVCIPTYDNLKDADYIVLTSVTGITTITSQLINLGIDATKIISCYIDALAIARSNFCEALALLQNKNKITGAVAEAGVFQGEFASVINKNYPSSKLYLFDTFEGFHEKDIDVEHNCGYSQAIKSEYSSTSIELVLSKMKYKENCIIKKGYFPDTAYGLENEKFCFVNLDMDLFKPTYDGLQWFEQHMIKGGVILVHDYFSIIYNGVKKAVDEFLKENSNIQAVPIGDILSILLIGF